MKSKQIVVIEDDESVCEFLGMLFDNLLNELDVQADVSIFHSATTYLKKWQQDQLVSDLLLSDVNMPGVSGLELIEKIRSEMPDTYYVIMSAEPDNQKPAMDFGANYFLSKPFVLKEIKGVLEQIC